MGTLCPAAAYTAGSRRVGHLSRAGGTLVTKDRMASSSRFRVVLTDMSSYVELAAAPRKNLLTDSPECHPGADHRTLTVV